MTSNCGQNWSSISEVIRQRISADGYERWFHGVDIVSDDGIRMVLSVPNPIHQFFIESNYLPLVQDAATEVLGSARKIQFVAPSREDGAAMAANSAAPQEAPAPKVTVRERPSAPASSGVSGSASGLNSRNTFETFVVGSNNQFAHGAAIAVAKSPAKTYNPFFVYGGSGLGKTHLLQSIGHYVLANQKSARVVYLSSEQFTNEFIDAIQHGTLVKFRKKYRQADVLMIDDIQFLAGKERSQEEFFHTFNTLHDGHKQIVLSSDRPASEIEKLEQRLVSRFEWGMTAELQPPDMETRIAILKKKAEGLHINVEPWVIEFLADRIRNNVRRLEGALMRVASYKSLSDREISRDVIENLLRDIFQEQARRAVTIEQIQRKVAEHYDVRLADMTSKRRPANIAFPRQVAMYLARELTNSSLNDIGDAFGGKDHGTVIHACKLIKRRIDEDEKTRHTIKMLDSQLQR
ncbi:chromosomal replication initiator protein [Terrimicrobium sacchariphilum]|uniref:Chromosomal replication initiator protein DnaA n=1 Tax=Terrimicrobium sacchariphilum TaxID=690879 RepID=A0A146GC61_TERSA|nr:chromosomal replication initiator protein DnaA [Terrimicrobium sacchariphilum]GAT34752.1 chromosomal replication initiator protein [Terrimicrobium sacchariphilum]